jgi:hypothetical protein
MSDLPRPYGGEIQRERDLTLGPVAPWHTTITVDVLHLHRGRHTIHPADVVFEVAAEWTGPPAIGFPPSARPVAARDVHPVGDRDLARALARRAAEEFARGGDQPPDLRELARELARSRST